MMMMNDDDDELHCYNTYSIDRWSDGLCNFYV